MGRSLYSYMYPKDLKSLIVRSYSTHGRDASEKTVLITLHSTPNLIKLIKRPQKIKKFMGIENISSNQAKLKGK